MFNYEYPPLGGGAGNAMFYLLKELCSYDNLEIDVVTASLDAYEEKKISPRITVYCLDIGKKGRGPHTQTNKNLFVFMCKSYFFGRKLMKQKQYDLCHAFFGIPCGYIALKLGLPYIVSLRGSDVPFFNKRFTVIDTLLFQYVSKRIWKKACKVIANSDELRSLALKISPQQSIAIIYNGVDTKKFCPPDTSKTNGQLVIISVGRLIARKGLEFLIRALEGIGGVRLLVVGEGTLKEGLKNLAQQCHVNATFVGKSDQEAVKRYLQESDIFVISSLNEGMSNALLEAMACGLPVVSTDTGGALGLVDGNGFIVPKGNHRAIANCIWAFLNDRTLLTTMGSRSREIALKMSWQAKAEDYYANYIAIRTPTSGA